MKLGSSCRESEVLLAVSSTSLREKMLELGEKVSEERYLLIRAYGLTGCCDQTPAWSTWLSSSRALLTL